MAGVEIAGSLREDPPWQKRPLDRFRFDKTFNALRLVGRANSQPGGRVGEILAGSAVSTNSFRIIAEFRRIKQRIETSV